MMYPPPIDNAPDVPGDFPHGQETPVLSVEDALDVLRHRLNQYVRLGPNGADACCGISACIEDIERLRPKQHFHAVELNARPLTVQIAKACRVFLDDATVQSMLRDVSRVESTIGNVAESIPGDLCCHLKALIADRDLLLEYTKHLWGQIEDQRDEMSLMKAELDRREFDGP